VKFFSLTNLASGSRGELLALAVTMGAMAFILVLGSSAVASRQRDARKPLASRYSHASATLNRFRLAQDEDDSGDSNIAPSDLEKYVAIYRDMQKDRSLTVEQAVAKEGLSLAAFRDLEQKVERDDAAREHVRDELEQSAAQASGASSSPQPTSAN
jgi:hypothetical protein